MNRFAELFEELREQKIKKSPFSGSKSDNGFKPKGKLKTFNLYFKVKNWIGVYVPEGTVEYQIVKDGKSQSFSFIYNSPDEPNQRGIVATTIKLYDNQEPGTILFRYNVGRKSVPFDAAYFKGDGTFRIQKGSSTLSFDVSIGAEKIKERATSHQEAISKVYNAKKSENSANGNLGFDIKIFSIGGGGGRTWGSENGQSDSNRQGQSIESVYDVYLPLPLLTVKQN